MKDSENLDTIEIPVSKFIKIFPSYICYCVRCLDKLTICYRCVKRKMLCPECAKIQRKESVRAAQKRYNSSEKGRLARSVQCKRYRKRLHNKNKPNPPPQLESTPLIPVLSLFPTDFIGSAYSDPIFMSAESTSIFQNIVSHKNSEGDHRSLHAIPHDKTSKSTKNVEKKGEHDGQSNDSIILQKSWVYKCSLCGRYCAAKYNMHKKLGRKGIQDWNNYLLKWFTEKREEPPWPLMLQ